MRFYIASRLDNAHKVRKLAAHLKRFGWEQTYDWTLHGSVQGCGEDVLREVSLKELDGVKAADAVVVILPGGRGTHAELGAALALNIPVFVWGEKDEDFIQDGYTCSFYWNPLVKRVTGGMLDLVMAAFEFNKAASQPA